MCKVTDVDSPVTNYE